MPSDMLFQVLEKEDCMEFIIPEITVFKVLNLDEAKLLTVSRVFFVVTETLFQPEFTQAVTDFIAESTVFFTLFHIF